MRRSTRLAALLTAGILALATAGCGSEDDPEDDPTTGSGDSTPVRPLTLRPSPTSRSAWPTTSVAAATSRSTTPPPLVSTRPSRSSASSSEESEAESDGEAETAREERLRTFADAGFNPIIAVGFAYSGVGRQGGGGVPRGQLRDHRRLRQLRALRRSDPVPNVACLVFAEEQGSFLVGAAAALKSEADHIGFVGGVQVPLIEKFQAGYEAGAKAVNPDITIDVTVPHPGAGLLRLR